jgi:tetratricopeptide (TPR) repeat protein
LLLNQTFILLCFFENKNLESFIPKEKNKYDLNIFKSFDKIIVMIKEGYPGNPNLPENTKFRIEASFRQAISLYLNGNMEDCIMGCDFILKLDPLFEPAKIIMEKAKDPTSPVDISEIIARYGSEEEINLEELLIKAIEFYNKRDFEKTLEILNKVLIKDPNNNEAKEMFERAKEKLEIQAFVLQFIKRAKSYFEEGSFEESLKEIQKGLALDETNPELLELKEKIETLKREPEEVQMVEEEKPKEEAQMEEIPSITPQEEVSGSFQLQQPEVQEELPQEERTEPIEEEVPSKETIETFQVSEPSKTPAQIERIQALINEGERAFQLGEFQEAIDIWSRIFLINMNNEEAAKRIEEAKLKIAEEERKIEELYNLALSLFQQGKKEEAKKHFQDILSIDPHHIGARNYLKQLEEEEKTEEVPKIQAEEKRITLEEILPEIPKKVEAPKVAPKKKKLLLPLLIGFFVIFVLVVGWFLMEEKDKGHKPLSPDLLLTKAQGLISQGKYEDALKELSQINPEAKEYSQAIELITKIKETMASKRKETVDGRPVDVVFKEYRDIAYNAYKEKNYAKAEEYYKKAQELKPLSFEDKAFFDDIQKLLNQINSAKTYVSSGNYEQAISILEPIYKEEKILQAKELLVLANYNLGISKLKEEDLDGAYKYFKEVSKIDPEDEEAKRNIKFIERYKEARKDLLYQIYIKYITSR